MKFHIKAIVPLSVQFCLLVIWIKKVILPQQTDEYDKVFTLINEINQNIKLLHIMCHILHLYVFYDFHIFCNFIIYVYLLLCMYLLFYIYIFVLFCIYVYIFLYYHVYAYYIALRSTLFNFLIFFLLDLYDTKPFVRKIVVL